MSGFSYPNSEVVEMTVEINQTDVRILLVDTNPIFQVGVITVLERRFPKVSLGCVSSFRGAIERLLSERWDLVISDTSLPDRSGLELVQEARRMEQPVPVLVLSDKPVRAYGCRAVRHGAAGYLRKDISQKSFLQMVEQAINGERCISQELALALADVVDMHEENPPHELLSDREFRVLVELAKGKGPKEIASDLALSPKTVSTYRTRINLKLKTHTDMDLVRYCISHQLIPSLCEGCERGN